MPTTDNSPTIIGQFRFGAPPIVFAIVEYYCRRFGINRKQAIRAIILECARNDPDFKMDDLVTYVKRELRPQLEEHDDALESLDRDLKRIMKGEPTVDSAVLHRPVSSPSAPIDPKKKREKNIGPRFEIDPNSPSPARAVLEKLKEMQREQKTKKKTKGRK